MREVLHKLKSEIEVRKQAEEAMKKSEKKYRSIFENVQDVFYQTDLNTWFWMKQYARSA